MTENTISEFDLFTYYLQKNFWTKIPWEDFMKICEQQGMNIIKEEHNDEQDLSKHLPTF